VRSVPGELIQFYGNPDPVTYSWTIAEFPSRAVAPGFFATLFLAPDGGGSDTPDWNDPNCIVVETSLNAALQGTCSFRFKTNAPNSNGVLYGAGYLGQLVDPSGVLGTWSVTFTNNSYVTLVGPSGVSTNFNMGPDVAALFQVTSGFMPTYFGFQPGGPANIGYRGVYSRLKIQNGATIVVDDTFPVADPLTQTDPNLWLNAYQAPDDNAGKVVDHDGAYWLDWNKPDGFFSFVGISANLTSWADSALTTIDHGARTASFVDTNILVDFPNSVYFRLYGTNAP